MDVENDFWTAAVKLKSYQAYFIFFLASKLFKLTGIYPLLTDTPHHLKKNEDVSVDLKILQIETEKYAEDPLSDWLRWHAGNGND